MKPKSKVLVAYASKYGSTTEIAERIGQVLARAGLEVDVLPADQTGEIGHYQAVVLGSAVYAGHWLKEAVAFLESNEAALAQRPVWLFSSGPTGEGDPVEILDGWRFPHAQQAIADRIKPQDIAVFHGKVDLSALHLGDKLIIKAVKAKVGDYRDWEAIEAWAGKIAQQLAKPEPSTSLM
ncbi:MAG: flavodoxin domain-containing protein [Anaerolineae bacterium]|nr:flavodoxin domain-containing protein [Candidatus Roseilinea sp.]MDW8449120.1 flavodoxin domain-containing protein [Anaerolineae bacterium]